MANELDRSTALVFGGVAETYNRIRPGYPNESVRFALDGIALPSDVVDVGAGTGLLTQQLVALGHRVSAVEPDAEMRAVLSAKLAGVACVNGVGESLPFGDASIDAIVVAQAFHWMREEESFAEFRRVVRPGGVVSLLWNDRDSTRAAWNAELTSMLRSLGENTTAHRMTGVRDEPFDGFEPYELDRREWFQELDEAGVIDLVRSRSYVIALQDNQRTQFLHDAREMLRRHPDLVGSTTILVPYTTSVYRFRRLQ